MFIRAHALVFTLVLVQPLTALCDDSDVIKTEATLIEKDYNIFEAVARIGRLPVGAKRIVDVELTNATANPVLLPRNNARASCGCLRVGVSREKIPPGETAIVRVELEISAGHKSPVWMEHVSFSIEESQASVRLAFISDVGGILTSEQDRLLLFVDDEPGASNSRDVRIVTTSPVKFENIKVTGDPQINLFQIGWKRLDDNHALLSVSVDANDVPPGGVISTVSLTDTTTKRTSKLHITAIKRSPVRISPSAIRIQPHKDNNGRFIGTAIVHRHKKDSAVAETRNGRQIEPPDEQFYASARLSGKSLEVESTRMSRDAVRVTVSGSDELLLNIEKDGLEPVIEWSVIWGKTRVSTKSRLLLIGQFPAR